MYWLKMNYHWRAVGAWPSLLAFITRAERGITWGGTEDELQKLDNPEVITLLVLCDTWLRNRDRWPGIDSANRTEIMYSSRQRVPRRVGLC